MQLMRYSWHILKQDKELLLLPILSACASIAVFASFFLPVMSKDAQNLQHFFNNGPQMWMFLFLFYVTSYFVIVFFNSALIASADKRMDGGDPDLMYGLRASVKRIHLIFGWAVIAGTVGMVLQVIEQRSEWLGRLLASLFGMFWSLATFFVVPLLVIEEKSPVDAIRESGSMLSDTWGEHLISNFSFGIVFFVLSLPGYFAIALGFFTLSNYGTFFAILGILYVLMLALINTALEAVFRTALFRYARYGYLDGEFDEDSLMLSFSHKGEF